MGTCLWNLNSKYWHCPITNESYWPVPHGPSSLVDPTIIDPELTMAFLNLLLVLQVFNFDDAIARQTAVIERCSPIEWDRRRGTSIEHQYCTASTFDISLMSLSNSCALTLPLPFFTPSPLTPPSLPNTKPWPLHLRCCYSANSGASEWSSVQGPRPEPGRRQTIWETRRKKIVKNMRNLPIILPIPISKCWFQAARTHETIKNPCQFATLCTFNEALVWGILELEFWTHQ